MSVTLNEFGRLDIRIGRVLGSERIKGTAKLFKLKIDLGTSETEIVAGGGEFYQPEYFVGKNLVVLINLQPKVIAGIESRGMVLAADDKDRPVWLTVPEEVSPGTKVR